MSLYLKYRPQNFNELVGQDHISITLQNAIKENTLAHAYLFCGGRGTGKTSTARILAKAINCTDNNDPTNPCNNCNCCQSANNGNLVDLIEIDAASNRGIDEIRDLREKIQFTPSQASKKIYIIDEVHMLTKEAFNAILKTLEEPPEHVFFILATTEAHKIPETIISRCQKFNFRQLSEENIITTLTNIAKLEKVKIEIEALDIIAKQANGGLRDAISIFEQLTCLTEISLKNVQAHLGLVGNEFLEKFYINLISKNLSVTLDLINDSFKQGFNLEQINRDIIEYLRTEMHKNLNNQELLLEIVQYIEYFSASLSQIKSANIPQLPLEIALHKICINQNSAPSIKQPERSKPIEIAVSDHDNLNIATIQNSWTEIIKKISTPYLKISMQNGQAIELTDNKLVIEFKNNFHFSKVKQGLNQEEILKALKNLFNKNFRLKFILNETIATPISPSPTLKIEKKENLEEMVTEIFD